MENVMKTAWSESDELFDESNNQNSDVTTDDYTKDDMKQDVNDELDNLEKLEDDDYVLICLTFDS
jgi:hypothetical protein